MNSLRFYAKVHGMCALNVFGRRTSLLPRTPRRDTNAGRKPLKRGPGLQCDCVT